MSAYVIVDIDVHDPVGYEDYKHLAPAGVAAYGGRYLARGGAAAVIAGAKTAAVTVMEFSYDMQRYVEDALSAKLLRGQVANRSRVVIGVDGDKLSFRSEPGATVTT